MGDSFDYAHTKPKFVHCALNKFDLKHIICISR